MNKHRQNSNFSFAFTLLLLVVNVKSLYASVRQNHSDYLKLRKHILTNEEKQCVGGKLMLNQAEEIVNKYIMVMKEKELGDPANSDPLPSKHFYHAKSEIDKSSVFLLLKRLPKGAALHVHDLALADGHWLLNNLTYLDNVYFKYITDDKGESLMSFKFLPHQTVNTSWTNIQSHRSVLSKLELKQFNKRVYESLTIVTDNPWETFPNQTSVWTAFSQRFRTLQGLLGYAPAFRAYIYQSLDDFYKDNIMYLEVRSTLTLFADVIYELNGTSHDVDWLVQTFKNVSDEFVKTHPGFLGLKLIHSTSRSLNRSAMRDEIRTGIRLVKQYPDFVVGFDLVGREDSGQPLKYYLDELLEPASDVLKYFFHAGETDHFGTIVDENLIDAILLNTSRIGHGFAITKHPELIDLVKARDIAIEVNPISNQVLGLVRDLRDHPAAVLYSHNVPMVISCDDPMLWEAKGVSYDFYEAFMGFSGRKSDLRFIKQLAINSLKYSALDKVSKASALNLWKKEWMTAIDEIIQHSYIKNNSDIFSI